MFCDHRDLDCGIEIECDRYDRCCDHFVVVFDFDCVKVNLSGIVLCHFLICWVILLLLLEVVSLLDVVLAVFAIGRVSDLEIWIWMKPCLVVFEPETLRLVH